MSFLWKLLETWIGLSRRTREAEALLAAVSRCPVLHRCTSAASALLLFAQRQLGCHTGTSYLPAL